MPDWTQLATMLPSVVAGLKGSGAETAAFMEGYQRTTQMLEQQRMQQQSLDEAGRRTDLAESEQEYRHGQDALRNKQSALDTLLGALPGLASSAQPEVTGATSVETPLGPVGVPTVQGPESGVMAQIQSLAGLLDQPDLAPSMGPLVKPAITRAEAARQNQWREAHAKAVALAQSQQKSVFEQDPTYDPAITVVLPNGQKIRKPYSEAVQVAGMLPVRAGAKATEPLETVNEGGKPILRPRSEAVGKEAYYKPPASVSINTGADVAALPPDPTSTGILNQTGLSLNAFRVLTGNASQLSRDRATRERATREADAWARTHGIDVSTLASQYKAQNAVLERNIERLNNTKIMESELKGTVENLQSVIGNDLSAVRFANVMKVWAGEQVNDPQAQQYAFHLGQLRNELAAYYAAAAGRPGSGITISDLKDAENTIKNGIAQGGLRGIAKGVEDSTSKMGPIMQASVDRAAQAVWSLFGVGENYKGKTSPPPPGIPDAVSSALKGQGDGRYTLTDGSVWVVRNGQITKGQ